MAVDVFNLDRAARAISVMIAASVASCIAASVLIHPYCIFALALVLPLWIADLWCRGIQKRHAILRNFGLFGVMRYVLESVGPELRQYWIASDTEERPFSRRERTEVYQYAKNEKIRTAAFGTQLKEVGSGAIRHSMFPLTRADLTPFSLTFGEERGCAKAFTISKPFMISAMSFGALGEPAVRALARGAKKAGIAMNTGEGGLPKYHIQESPDLIFQMGTAKFGCRKDEAKLDDEKLKTIADTECVKMIEIKFSQGAKPGAGGLLPGAKVTAEISELRGIPQGRDCYSPPRHAECDTPANTVKFIRRVQDVSGLPVGIKFCLGSESELVELIREMKRQNIFPDYIALDGSEGGTGAAPAAFLDHVGIPLFPALAIVTRVLESEGVRSRLKLITAGKLINAPMQMKAFAHGADAVYTARGFLFAIGCIHALQCNTDHCPAGITTHNPRLQRGLDIEEKSQRVASYVKNLEHMLYELLAATGRRSFEDLTPDVLFTQSYTQRGHNLSF